MDAHLGNEKQFMCVSHSHSQVLTRTLEDKEDELVYECTYCMLHMLS